MTTIVLNNGHLRTETTQAAIDALIEILRDHPLNRLFERHGNFVERDARNLRGEWLEGIENAVSFFGNFFDRSHVFNIVSNDAYHVERLCDAIAANRLRADYLRQPPPYDPDKLVIERKPISATQSEVLLIYDGQRIEPNGGRVRLDGRGDSEERDAYYWQDWHGIARRELARRHVEAFDRGLKTREPPASS